MEHKDIVELVESMIIVPLNEETFDGFVKSATDLFLPTDSRFQEFYSPSCNTAEDKLAYQIGNVLVSKGLEKREFLEKDRKWINVYMNNKTEKLSDTLMVGINMQSNLDFKFGFAPGKALYVAEEEGNSAVSQPWETVYVKLD